MFDACDYAQLAFVTRASADINAVTYTRFVRKDVINVYEDDTEFTVGKGVVLNESKDADEALDKLFEALKS